MHSVNCLCSTLRVDTRYSSKYALFALRAFGFLIKLQLYLNIKKIILKNVIYNRPSNKFIFRATYGNSIVCNINKIRLEDIFNFCSAFSLFFLHGIWQYEIGEKLTMQPV
jgi:hypothetical protein